MSDYRRRRLAEMFCAGTLTLIGAIAAIMALHYGLYGNHNNLGPGATPFFTAIILLVLGAITGTRAAIEYAHPVAPPPGSVDALLEVAFSPDTVAELGEATSDGSADTLKPWKILGLTLAAAIAAPWI